MRAFSLRITPSTADIDELGHVNNAVWVRWIQDVATAHWNAVASAEHVARWIWVVVRHEIDYLGNVGVGETVMARTWISDPPKGARFDRNMEFSNASGKIVVRSKTTWAIVDRTTGRIARVPLDVAEPFLEDAF
ncbi:acyl-CoA thioesterase [Aquisediminimonas profunda]|uniref:acyl-CoA thioesterase n=1 Tax=Aquisediminimonas profunda TaxID=1550733 RepID=UPI001C6289F7|nr:acyl-CoA thioesterase [Aquisediminimonas profunda]